MKSLLGIPLVETPTGFEGERLYLKVELQRYVARYHGGDQQPEGEAGDRWIGFVYFGLSGRDGSSPWWSPVHEARCYGIEAAANSIERFVADARDALGCL